MRINLTAKGENQKLVLAYLEENASDVLVEKINSGKKTMNDCWDFIMKCAEKKLNKKNGAIRDDVVFGWAIHFFEEDSIDPVEEDKKTKEKFGNDILNHWSEKSKSEKKPKPEKKSELDNQISLFDLVGGMV